MIVPSHFWVYLPWVTWCFYIGYFEFLLETKIFIFCLTFSVMNFLLLKYWVFAIHLILLNCEAWNIHISFQCIQQKGEVEKQLLHVSSQAPPSTDNNILLKHLQEELRNYVCFFPFSAWWKMLFLKMFFLMVLVEEHMLFLLSEDYHDFITPHYLIELISVEARTNEDRNQNLNL